MVPSRRPARAVLASWPPSLDPLDRMGDFPRAPAQSQLRARKSLLILLLQSRTTVSPETSIPRTDARSLTGCLPPTSTSCPFGTSRLPLVHVGDCRGRSSQESAILRKEREDRVDVNEAVRTGSSPWRPGGSADDPPPNRIGRPSCGSPSTLVAPSL